MTEISQNYGVSKITAIRAMEVLAGEGIVKKVHGRGTFITGFRDTSNYATTATIKKIALIASNDILSKRGIEREIFLGVSARATELGLIVRIEQPKLNSVGTPILALGEDEVGITYFGIACGEFASVFYNGRSRGVVVDGFVPGAVCIMTDNAFGMRLLIAFLQQNGCKKAIIAPHFTTRICSLNGNERLEEFLSATVEHDIFSSVYEQNNFDGLIELMHSADRPDAILFSHDDPALNCIQTLEENGFEVPRDVIVCGYDGFSASRKDISRLVTVKVKPYAMGTLAVDIIAHGELELQLPRWHRVKPELFIGANAKL